MKKFDYRFSEAVCQKMVGQEFVKYRCDEPDEESVTEIVGLYIGDKAYRLENIPRPMEYFGDLDDVGVFRLYQSQDYTIISPFEDMELVDFPVGKNIRSIKLVNDLQRMSERGKPAYEMWLTRAIIFCLDDEELMFLKDYGPITDEIFIRRGHNLLETVPPESKCIEGWPDRWEEDQTPECTREILDLQQAG